MKKIIIFAMLSSVVFLAGCKEEEPPKPELKTIEYWQANQKEKMDYWLDRCKDKVNDDDNCKVLGALNRGGVRVGQKEYDRITNRGT